MLAVILPLLSPGNRQMLTQMFFSWRRFSPTHFHRHELLSVKFPGRVTAGDDPVDLLSL
jgi:hypothetical protein